MCVMGSPSRWRALSAEVRSNLLAAWMVAGAQNPVASRRLRRLRHSAILRSSGCPPAASHRSRSKRRAGHRHCSCRIPGKFRRVLNYAMLRETRMRQSLSALESMNFDVAVIGAGVNGASAAQHLAAAGYRVLLVDKSDFASGSSGRSSRLLHCGLRYLAPGDSMLDFVFHPNRLAVALRMAKQAMDCRAQIVRTAGERTHAMNFCFPIYRNGPRTVASGHRLPHLDRAGSQGRTAGLSAPGARRSQGDAADP